jgi:hypothetical protein
MGMLCQIRDFDVAVCLSNMKVLRLISTSFLVLLVCGIASGQEFHWQSKKMGDLSRAPIVRQMHLPDSVRQSIVDQSVKAMRADSESFGDLADAQLWYLAENEGYMFADLDGDGRLELITQGYGVDQCGGVGNCPLRVFRRHGNRYELVLNWPAESLMVDRFDGKPVLVLYTHRAAGEGTLYLYRVPHSGKAKLLRTYDVMPGGSEPRLESRSNGAADY